MQSTKWLGIAAVVVVLGIFVYWMNQSKTPDTTDQNPANQQASETVKLSSKANMGNFLVDDRGMTLYYFPKDTINKSNCAAGQCLTAWPIFYTQDVVVSGQLNKNNFGQITRDDGAKQSTYKGWPLYYYFKDAQPGDTLGE